MSAERTIRLVSIVVLVLAALWFGDRLYTRFALTVDEPRVVTPRGDLSELEKSVIELFGRTAPSVAYIFTETLQRRSVFGAVEVAQGAGSGFVWDSAGHVVTNFHVVEGANRVNVQLDVSTPIRATVVGVAPEYDLAVVRLTDVPVNLRPIPLGTSGDLSIGQSVFAIGNPFGLSRTLTSGIVSAVDRHLPTAGGQEISGVIQTDAAINPGNSGGPLLDSTGRLIGVNTAILSESGSSAGVGFAIPVDLVNRIVPELIQRGKARRPGIGILAADPAAVAPLGIKGVVIVGISQGSPAAATGLFPVNRQTGEIGDVIIAVDGQAVENVGAFVQALEKAGIGKEVELTVRRGDRERQVMVKVIDVS